jgi:hypothetical protein
VNSDPHAKEDVGRPNCITFRKRAVSLTARITPTSGVGGIWLVRGRQVSDHPNHLNQSIGPIRQMFGSHLPAMEPERGDGKFVGASCTDKVDSDCDLARWRPFGPLPCSHSVTCGSRAAGPSTTNSSLGGMSIIGFRYDLASHWLRILGLLITFMIAGAGWDQMQARSPRKDPPKRVVHGPNYRPP